MKKWIAALFLLIMPLGACSGNDMKTISLSCQDTNVRPGETLRVDIKTNPVDKTLVAENIHTSGGEVSMESDGLVFTADEPGIYTISATADDVSSNQITIVVSND